MKKKKKRESIKKILKDLLRMRISSLQGEMGHFARNPVFPENVKTANICLIENDIASLRRRLRSL